MQFVCMYNVQWHKKIFLGCGFDLCRCTPRFHKSEHTMSEGFVNRTGIDLEEIWLAHDLADTVDSL